MRRFFVSRLAVATPIIVALAVALALPGFAQQEYAVEKVCQVCHKLPQGQAGPVTPTWETTKHATATGEGPRYSTNGDPGVGCQVCHGPGQAHVKAGTADKKTTASNPDVIESWEGRMSLCGRCHAQYDEGFIEDYAWGDNILDKITLKEPTGGLLEQVNEMKDSLHFTSTKGTNPSCIDCHSGHKEVDEALPHQIRKPINELCGECHGPEVADALHCQHEVPPDGTCATCHMPERKHIFKVTAQ